MTRQTRVVPALIVTAMVGVVGPSSSSAFRGHKVYVAAGANTADARYRPWSFWLSGDPTLLATKVGWSSYNGSVARARAVGHANNCSPDCSRGHFKKGLIRLRLSNPRHSCGHYIYSHVRITWVHRPPLGGPRSFRLDPGAFC
jgi:hypothetical protein